MSTALSSWEYIEIVNGADTMSEPCTPDIIYHCSDRNIESLQVNDSIYFDASEGFFGEGVYFSSRPEMIYGKNVFVLNNEPCIRISKTLEYSWYLVLNGEFRITSKIENLIFIERIH